MIINNPPIQNRLPFTLGSHPFCMVFSILILCLALNGCSSWWGPPAEIRFDSDVTRQLMDRVTEANKELETFTGMGKVTVNSQDTQRVYNRAVWVGAEPGRLRFAFRSPAGMPVFSMSCDETWVAALNHTDGQYYRRKIGNNSMSRLLPVEIKCADLYGLMAGRPPRIEYDAVQRDEPTDEDAEDIVLVLKRRFRGAVARIGLDRETGDFRSIEMLDIGGKRRYLARLQSMKTFGDYRLPVTILLTGPSGSLELNVKRITPGAAIKDDLFRIKPPTRN